MLSGNFLLDSESRMREAAAQSGSKDPVCGMPVKAQAAAGAHSEYRGTGYSFCSKQCKERFDREPETYIRKNSPA